MTFFHVIGNYTNIDPTERAGMNGRGSLIRTLWLASLLLAPALCLPDAVEAEGKLGGALQRAAGQSRPRPV